ncbi:unnamed protein product [Prunus armeniaca]
MEMRLVACERMSGTQCSKKTPLSLCFVKQLVCNGVACERMSRTQCSKKTSLSSCFVEQLVCNGDEACCRHVYVRQTQCSKKYFIEKLALVLMLV